MAKRDYYETLGVARGANADEIRAAHRRLARKHHPDVNKSPDAAKTFSDIQEAYDVLSDPEKRRAYDQFGHAGVGVGAGAAGSRPRRPGGQHEGWTHVDVDGVDPADFASVFEQMFGGGGPFGGGFGSTRARRPAASRGEDVTHELAVSFLTAALGGSETLRVSSDQGESETIEVRIPPGIESGAKLRVRGRGVAGRAGGEKGDLILTINVGDHPYFTREGLDVSIDVPINIAEAALGTTVTVPLLRGTVQLKVSPGASSGRKLRVRGKGIVDAKGRAGDFFAVVQIVAPESLSADDRQRIQEVAERLKNPRTDVPWADLIRDGGS
jgi:DnaJ-class molecular chaperone